MNSKGYALNTALSSEDKTQAELAMLRVNYRLSPFRTNTARESKLIVWIGDAHLHQKYYEDMTLPEHYRYLVSTARQLRLALYEIGLLNPRPDLVILGGDLVEYGFREEYEYLFEIIDAELGDIPCIYLSGNHEHSEGELPSDFKKMYELRKRDYWPELTSNYGLYYTIRHSGFKFVCIDREVDKPNAGLNKEQFNWLENELKTSNDPIIVCSHRPLLPVGNWIDDRFPDADLWRLIDSFPHIRAVLSGHSHTYNLWTYRDKLHVVFPATSYSVGTITGWGGLIVNDDDIERVFVKELQGPSYNSIYPTKLQIQDGNIHFLDADNFEENPLFNPEIWART